MMQALPSCNDAIRQKTCLMTARSAVGRNRIRPMRSCPRHEMCAREFGAKPFTSLQLVRLNHHPAVSAASPGKPGQWTFIFVDDDVCTAILRCDLSLSWMEMLCAKAVDLRLLRFRRRLSERATNYLPTGLGIYPCTPGSQPGVTLHAGAAVAPTPFVLRAASVPRHNSARPLGSRHSDPISRDTAQASCCIGYANAASAI